MKKFIGNDTNNNFTIVGIREIIREDNWHLKEVDEDELPRVRTICEALATYETTMPQLTIRATNDIGETKLSIAGFNKFISMPDYCNYFHSRSPDTPPEFKLILDSRMNPATGELELTIKKASARSYQKEKLHIKPPLSSSSKPSAKRRIEQEYEDEEEQEDVKPKRRAYVPK